MLSTYLNRTYLLGKLGSIAGTSTPLVRPPLGTPVQPCRRKPAPSSRLEQEHKPRDIRASCNPADRLRGTRSGLPWLPAASGRPDHVRPCAGVRWPVCGLRSRCCRRQVLVLQPSECDDCVRSIFRLALNRCKQAGPPGATTNSITEMGHCPRCDGGATWHHRVHCSTRAHVNVFEPSRSA